jgi:Histidine kinase-, DNA gyrase B-, and HSP90-like ATPase
METKSTYDPYGFTKEQVSTLDESTPTRNSVRSQRFSFDNDSLVHLMGAMTRIYSNSELAVLREYSTNAYDAHQAIGNSAPIEVTLPSLQSPVFVVQDHGIGMSSDDVLDIYSKYGASTKRQSTTQSGEFGLGCKSAITITDEFFLTAIKNGIKANVTIAKDPDGGITAHIDSEEPTDAPNGVTVRIPVSNVHKFTGLARDFFMTWKPGTVLVGGQTPPSIYDDGFTIVNDIHYQIIDFVGNRTFCLVIGGVSYPISMEYVPETLRSLKVKAYIHTPIAAVDLVPARESLRYSEKTREYVKTVMQIMEMTIQTAGQKEIDAIESDRRAVIATKTKWQRIIGTLQSSRFTWKGEVIPDCIESNKGEFFERKSVQRRRTVGVERSEQIHIVPTVHPQVIIMLPGDAPIRSEIQELNAHLRGALRHIQLNPTSDSIHVYYTQMKMTSPWVLDNTGFKVLTSKQIIFLARAERAAVREANRRNAPSEPDKVRSTSKTNTYHVYTLEKGIVTDSAHLTADKLDAHIIYAPQQEIGTRWTNDLAESVKNYAARHFFQDGKILVLRATQSREALRNRLIKRYADSQTDPTIESVTQHAGARRQSLAAQLSDDTLAYLHVRNEDMYSRAASLDSVLLLLSETDGILDDNLRRMVQIAQAAHEFADKYRFVPMHHLDNERREKVKEVAGPMRQNIISIKEKYSLLFDMRFIFPSSQRESISAQAKTFVNGVFASLTAK